MNTAGGSDQREEHSRAEAPTELDVMRGASNDSSRVASAWLVVRGHSGMQVIEIQPDQELRVGRSRDSDIFVDDPRVSRVHARIYRVGDALWVHDFGSRNGTRVNDKVLRGEQARLSAGDRIRVADMEAAVALVADRRVGALEPPAAQSPQDRAFVVADQAMTALVDRARKVAVSDAAVLILGETGVGKEVLARQIHDWGPTSSGPFVRVNLPALPENLLESQLFGYERGAFTGADRSRPGFFEAASGGTLLLDEIGDLPMHMQVKLLSVLENRCVIHLGGVHEIPVRARVMAATHRDLEKDVDQGRFRRDLYYRIASFTLRIPPLRERPTEILLLAGMIVRKEARRMQRPEVSISEQAARLLTAWHWPGNVREVRNAMEHALVLAEAGVILPEHLPDAVRKGSGNSATGPLVHEVAAGPQLHDAVAPEGTDRLRMQERLSELERGAIEAALAQEQGNRTRAAVRLGMSRRALIYKLHKYGLG